MAILYASFSQFKALFSYLVVKEIFHFPSILTGVNSLFLSNRKLGYFKIVLYLEALEAMDIEAESYA
jgi:hypothetical protein